MIAAFYPALDGDVLAANLFAAQASGGYLKSFAAYGASADPRYAAIFLPVPPGRTIVQQLSGAIGPFNVATRIADAAKSMFFPEAITTTADDGFYSHTILFRRANPVGSIGGRLVWNPPEMRVVPMRSWADFTAPTGELVQADNAYQNLVSIDAFQLGADVHVSAVFQTNPQMRNAWAARMDYYEGREWDSDDRYRAMQRSWARPEALIPLPKQALPKFNGPVPIPSPLLTLWMGDTFEPWPNAMDQESFSGGTFTRGPITSNGSTSAAALAQAFIDDLSPDWWPIHVGANGTATNPIFGLTFARTGQTQPLARMFRVVDIKDGGAAPKSFLGLRPSMHPMATHHARAMADEPPFATRANEMERFIAETQGEQPLPAAPPVHLPSPTLAVGAPPSGVPKTEKATPQRKRDMLDPFPDLIRAMMLASGVRAAQLAIARNGKLVYSKAFVYAEPNYPEVTPHHLFRVGSLGKPLTAMPIVAHYQTATNLEQPLTDALGIQLAPVGQNAAHQTVANPNIGLMSLVRVGDTLRHRTGWGSTSNNTQSFDFDTIRKVVGNDPPQPGDVSAFLAKTVDSVFSPTGFPRLTSAYNNWNFSVLGELVSYLGTGNRALFEQSMRRFWTGLELPPRGYGIPRLYGGSWPSSSALGAAPGHLRVPGYSQVGHALLPGSYGGDDSVEGGAGNWEIAASQVARVLTGMDPSGPRVLLEAAQVRLLHSPYEYEASDPTAKMYDDGQGLGFQYDRIFYDFGGFKPTACVRLYHNGAVEGGASVGCHVLPVSGAVSPSVTVVLAMNEDVGLGATQLDAILAALQTYEQAVPWPAEDLFSLVTW